MNKTLISKIKAITNILWAGGVVNPVTYIEQISYLIYLKRYDEKLKGESLKNKLLKKESSIEKQKEKYRWHQWVVRSGENLRNFVRDEVFPHMEGLFKENPGAAEYFRGAQLQITDPNTLKEVVDILNTIEFSDYGPDLTGDLFEYMLTHLGTSSLNGQFRTPKQIRSFMVEMIDPDYDDTILDPACGTGGFLLDSYDYIKYKHSENGEEIPIYGKEWKEDNQDEKLLEKVQNFKTGYGDKIPKNNLRRLLLDGFTGYDVNMSMVRIATMNLMLHGLDDIKISAANTLASFGGLDPQELNKKYSVILANPPFSGRIQRDSIRNDISIKSNKTEILFLSVIMDMLANGGRAAVVVPEGILFGTGVAYQNIRKRLVENFDIRAIISLHPGVFKPYAGVKTSVIVFEKPNHKKNLSSKDFVWFYEILNDGYDPQKITQDTRVETPGKSNIPEMLRFWDHYKQSGFREVTGIKGLSKLNSESELSNSWYVDLNEIIQNDYNLSAENYKPLIKQKIFNEKPDKIISDIIKFEKNIISNLKELLKKIENEKN